MISDDMKVDIYGRYLLSGDEDYLYRHLLRRQTPVMQHSLSEFSTRCLSSALVDSMKQ